MLRYEFGRCAQAGLLNAMYAQGGPVECYAHGEPVSVDEQSETLDSDVMLET